MVEPKSDLTPRVIDVLRLGADLIITFEDGRCAIYSAALLDAIFSQAQQIPTLEDEE